MLHSYLWASIHHHHHRKALLLQHRPPARHPLFHCLESGPMFTSQFSHDLFRLTGVKLQFSSAFHPQSDGKSEAPNKVITMLFHCLSVRSPPRLVALASLDGVPATTPDSNHRSRPRHSNLCMGAIHPQCAQTHRGK
jgi:hypothetical protein